MQRLWVTPRADAARRLEDQGLSFHASGQYWREDACYAFSLREIEQVESATAELHALCVAAARHLVARGELARLAVPEAFHGAIADSLARDDYSLYGRFDLAFDGSAPPKLLEYNADTPTSLLESAVCQWSWREDCHPDADQFNSLHERLVARWRELPGTGPVHLACMEDDEEDWACIAYLQDTLAQAGRAAVQLPIGELGWNDATRAFVDGEGVPIDTLFKLYPWEWMLREAFGAHVPGARTRFIEPLWKSLLSCKGLLAVLWELNPGHPNLLECHFEPRGLRRCVRKPLYSREGANVAIIDDRGGAIANDGPYGAEGHVYQALAPIPQFSGFHPVIGSWVVAGEPAGLCIREDRTPITSNQSHFVPHLIL